MNSNALIGYSGLINNNYSTSMNASDIVCDSITAQHYYNIFCQTIGITIGNPEISLLYDDLTNTFTLHIYSNSIPLSRLKNDIYDSLAIPSTLVFRDATNSTTLSNLTITGGIDLSGVGLTYKINGIQLRTSDIPENINLYYTDTRARLSISGTAPIIYTNSTGVISLNTTIAQAQTFTSTATFTNGSNAQGAPYSAVFGLASSTKSGQIALIDALTYNSYAQLYCRSRNFGVQGNIDTISLEKPTTIVSSLNVKSSMIGISHCLIDSTGVNIYSGESYKINGITLNTDDIQESLTPVNKYYTDARSRLAISVSTLSGSEILGSYNSTTGVITIPDITVNSILLTKLKTASANNIIVCHASTGIPTYVAMTGDLSTINGAMTISNDAITTIKVLNAAITPTKISVGTSGQILQTNASLVNGWVSMSGDTIISGTGFTTISNDAITTVKVANANITPAKISLGTVNQFLQTSSSSVNNWVSLSGDGTLTNGVMTISNNAITTVKVANANITPIKISVGTSGQILQTNASLVNGWVSMSGDTIISGSGFTTISNDAITTVKVLNANITPAKLSLGTVNQFLQTSSLLVNNWVTMNGDATLTNGVLSIANGVVSLLKLATASYSQLASAFSTLVQRDIYGGINVIKMKAEQIILTTSPYGTLDATAISKIVNITYPSVSSNSVPYCNTYATTLSGVTASLTGLSPTWNRVTTPTNTLEVSMYSKGDTALWKIEGQVVNYYVSPGTTCNINIGVFANIASTATIIGPSSNLVSSTFVNRNIYGASTTIVTPFICYYSIGGALYPEGTCFTFTVYVSGGGGGAIVCGRSANDIPSNICVTQLN